MVFQAPQAAHGSRCTRPASLSSTGNRGCRLARHLGGPGCMLITEAVSSAARSPLGRIQYLDVFLPPI